VLTSLHKPPYTYTDGRSVDRTTFADIGDTIAIRRVLYDSGFAIVPEDNLWVLARENPTRIFIVSIEIFISSSERQTMPPPWKPISDGLPRSKPP
jgi:hypothetical protein